ncbi:MAG: hypothetical protein HJJLKODD_02980 [Phycisphaerae bacterium]|nr:hypothetical protein [Phycisphaerae bacterium]
MAVSLKPSTTRLIQGLVFLMWVAAYGWLWWSGRYSKFVRPEFDFLMISGGLFCLLLLGVVLFPSRLSGGCCAPQVSDRLWVHGAILLLPLLFMGEGLNYRFTSADMKRKQLSNQQMAGFSADVGQDNTIQNEVPRSHGPQHLNILNLVRGMKQIQGQRVLTEGVVFRDDQLADDQLYVYRFVMICCANDARPVGILVNHPQASQFENDTWVHIEGIVGETIFQSQQIPLIKADLLESFESTESPFLYY